MDVKYTAQDLKDFELEILQAYEQDVQNEKDGLDIPRKVKGPVHLDNNNESHLLYIFQNLISEQDWVLCTWRSHYKALLKGVDKDVLKQAIFDGHSIGLNFASKKFLSSAIVAGNIPIGVGLGWGAKQKNTSEKVFIFVGDMAACTGVFLEGLNYVTNHELPVYFICEDNAISVLTKTLEVWGLTSHPLSYGYNGLVSQPHPHVYYYQYKSEFAHSGGKTRTSF
jgi:TPP-dependent pyruvate/acetoin dehydrogenase alpha subunit